MLSAADVKFYRDQDDLVVPAGIDPLTLEVVRAEIARILDGARALTTHTDRYDLEPSRPLNARECAVRAAFGRLPAAGLFSPPSRRRKRC